MSVVLPINTKLTIEQSLNGPLHVSGVSSINTLGNSGAAQISATAPSFKAGVSGLANVDGLIGALACIPLAGCDEKSLRIQGVNLGSELFAINTANKNPVSLFGLLDLPVPGLNSYYRIQASPKPDEALCYGPISPAGDLPDCSGSQGPIAVQRPTLAQVKVETLRNYTGNKVSDTVVFDPNVGYVTSKNSVLSATQKNNVFNLNADVTGMLQALARAPIDILNPKAELNLPGALGGAVSIGITLADYQLGLGLGFTQNLSVEPNLKAILEFDKDVYQYVDDTSKIASTTRVLVQTKNTYNFVTGGPGNSTTTAYSTEVNFCRVNGIITPDESQCTNNHQFFDQSRYLMLEINEPFHIYDGRTQCRPQRMGGWTNDFSSMVVCTTPVLIAGTEEKTYRDDITFSKIYKNQGKFVTVDLEEGADLYFEGGVNGNLLSRSYTMGDGDNFYNATKLSVSGQSILKAGCFKATLLTLNYDFCAYDRIDSVELAAADLFVDSFNLRGFDTAYFGRDVVVNDVSEPSTLLMAALALLGMQIVTRRKSQ